MKKHVSEEFSLELVGHSNYNFVDVNVLSDQKLFIDPCLIEISKSEWCVSANRTIRSYFDCFYKAYRDNDINAKRSLLSHAGEINCTRMGYGGGDNGHGNTVEGLLGKFKNLDRLAQELPTLSSAIDLPVLIPDFDKDGLSDMLTNIIHRELNDFTMSELTQLGVQPNCVTSFWTWDLNAQSWKLMENVPAYYAEKGELLLVPKGIVHFRYLCNIEQYLSRIILERMQNEQAYTDEKGKCRLPHKKDVRTEIVKIGDNWKYEHVVAYSASAPDTLDEYHHRIPEFYSNRQLSDEQLDRLIYKRAS